jgi:YHS domain-containing protein
MTKQSKLMALLAVTAFILVLAVAAQQKSDDKAVDPVCGMTVVKAAAKATFEYKGTKYYFCSTGCKDAFAKDPEKYLKKETGQKEVHDVLMPAPGMMGHRMGEGPMPERVPMGQRRFPMIARMMAMHHGGPMGMMAGLMGPGVNRLLLRRDVEWTFERTADGVTVKIASKDPETVKAIQERLAMMKEMRETMMAPAASGSGASSCSCPNCPMKEPVKK